MSGQDAAQLDALLADDFGMTGEDWKNAFDEASLTAMDEEEELSARVAEKPISYRERKPRPRR